MAPGKPPQIVVVGGEILGRRVVEELLHAGADLTVLADGLDPGFPLAVQRLGARFVPGNARHDEVLTTAGLADADCLVAVSDSDSVNLEIGLTARKLNPRVRVVLRLFDGTIAAKLENAFGFRSLNSAALAAPTFVSAGLAGSLVASLRVEGMRIAVHAADPRRRGALELGLAEGGLETESSRPDLWVECEPEGAFRRHGRKRSRKHRRVKNLWPALRHTWRHAPPVVRHIMTYTALFTLISIAVFWLFGKMTPLDAAYFVVTTVTTVGYGDINLQAAHPLLKAYGILMMLSGAGLLATVYAIIADRVLAARLDYILGRRGVAKTHHAVVVGLGKVGYRVAMEVRAMGLDVVAIELRGDSEYVAAARDHFPVVVGDGARSDVLRLACVEHAEAVIAVTDDSVLNLDVALRAKDFNAGVRTVLRTHEPSLVDHFRELGLDAVASASAIAAPAFAAAALDPHVVASFEAAGRVLQLVKLPAGQVSPGAVVLLKESAKKRFVAADNQIATDSGQVYALRVKPG